MTNQPLVSCIMPTANRQKYIPLALKHFFSQDYINSELVIIDDGRESIAPLLPDHPRIRYFYTEHLGNIGAKRNFACKQAKGEIIMHWDDDDFYAPDWISKQYHYLTTSGADICGIEYIHFFSPLTDTLWLGTAMNRNNPSNPNQWISGATFAYRKTFWATNPFKDLQTGEDDNFISKPGTVVFAHDYIDGFVAVLHPRNTTVKYFENPKHKVLPKTGL